MTIKRGVSLFLVLAVLATGLIGLHLFGKSRTTQLFGEIIARVETERPVVALTFDDGPTAGFTPEVLAILRERGVKATFFLTGKETEENLPQARMIVGEGHQIGNHSYTHSNMMLMGPTRIGQEIERTDAAIRAAGYEGEIMFRPPYGKKLLTLPWYLSRHERKTIMWDVEPESFPDVAADTAAFAKHVIEQTKSGSIIIMHVMYGSREISRQALPSIIDGLRQRGFEFVTVSQLLENR
ncbi:MULTISPECIES: polysaccharide deacetylase family protein [unclassified Agrobacterium]|uniref:polysaccharide deacetylase family protein n=1 Tax=unclassified Agrobacterium TaxID=2632611 RepID=UPI002448EAEA|nr:MULTISPECIES: polysaccharide deacetylase family protein [unclassified Agrobacterium]MDH0615809.1 polysaccharide deacetylase family protein [Agrobacterium sp. GD03872]MDH0697838.1 polysaccharide deacetylase family protein [Agrobacterium sp. GD03871]MDH1062661.1 polysaccharide deacetylase family protein [Agrobacterium sp. GD03992]MDH2211201.1 polysaccharide deacetylase family protein [Agrobacterium sp. GD03643]MDH2222855.1 polysaccharide deacetylase family protein [Agrobacterium sp. GD03638]